MQNSNISRSVHHLVRLSYFQRLLAHRRVLFVGDNLASAQFLCELRTRHISAITEQPPQPPWPGRDDTPGIELQVMQFNDVRFRDRAFDMAIVPDLTALKDPTASLNEFRRVVGPSGHVIVAAPNPACEIPVGPIGVAPSLDYYEVYDLLAEVFPNVQMIGQSPFFGYAVADLAFEDDELPVGFDAGLAENNNEEIEWFLSVCGEQAVELDPYSIIQVPLLEAGVGGASAQELEEAQAEIEREKENCSRISRDLEAAGDEVSRTKGDYERLNQDFDQARHELGNRGVKIESLQKELEVELQQSEAARERAVNLAKEFDNERKAAQKKQLDEEFARRSSTMETQTKLNEVGAKLRMADERAVAAENARDELVGQMRADVAELDRIREKYDSSKENLKRISEREKERKTDLDVLGQKLLRAEEQLVGLEPVREELKELKEKGDTESKFFAEENATLEERLQKTAASLLEAQTEVERRDAIVRDLVVRLEEREAAAGDATSRLEQMDMEIAALNGARSGQYHARIEAELELATMTLKAQDLSQELHQLRNQLDEKKDELSAGGAKLKAEENQTAELIATVNDRDLKIANQEGEIQSAKWRANELEARGVDALEQLKEAQNALDTKLAENENSGNQLQELESELAALNGARAGQHRARVEAELELATVNLKLTGLHAELTEMLARNSDLERQSDEGRERMSLLTQDVESARSQLEAVQTESAQVVADRDRVNEECGKARLKIEELESNLGSAQGQIESLVRAGDMAGELSDQIEKERNRASGFETGLAEAERQLLAVKEELETERNNRIGLDDERDKNREKSETLEKELAAAQESCSELADERDKNREKSETLEKELTAAQESCSELTDERDKNWEKSETLAKELTAAQESCSILTDERDRALDGREQFRKSTEEIAADRTQSEENLKLAQEKAKTLETAMEAQERGARIFEEEFDRQKTRTQYLEEELSGARQRVGDLENEIEESAKARARMENELATLAEQLGETKRTADDCSDEATQAVERASKAEEQIEALTKELHGAHEQRAVLETTVENTETSIRQEIAEDLKAGQRITEEFENVQKQLIEAQTDLERETNRNEGLTAAVEVLRSDLASEADRTVQAGTDAARVAGEIEEIKGQLARRENELKEATEERAASEGALTALRVEIARLDSDYRKVRSAHVVDDGQTKELAEQAKQLEISEKRFAEKEQEFSDAQERLVEAEKKVVESQASVAQTEDDLNGVQEQVKELEQEMEDIQEQNVAAENKLVAYAQAKVGISSQLADALQEKDEVSEELSAVREEIQKAKEAQGVLENRIVELETQAQEVEAASVSSSEVSKLESDLETVRSECTAALNQIEGLTQTIAEKEKNLEEVKNQVSEIVVAEPISEVPDVKEMEKLREMVGEREALIDSLTGQLEERERRTTGLERKIREMTNQLHEHESDIAAWNMELKFRNSRISQLESQLATMKLSIPPVTPIPDPEQ